jgi:lauroyl/myristoyl acyltransferase
VRRGRWVRAGLRRLLPLLGAVPGGIGEEALARAGAVKPMCEPAKRRIALAWAAHHATGRRQRWRIATSLLAQDGRILMFNARVGLRDLDAYRRRIRLEGLEHLDAARRRGGTLLVGFHVGATGTSAALDACGYSLTSSGYDGNAPAPGDPPTVQWSRRGQDRALAILRLRELLRAGQMVSITADALDGRASMTIPVPGGELPLRTGWLFLRRQTGATALPVLARFEGRTKVVVIHPPLPAPVADEAADTQACRTAMSEVLGGFIRRYPDQCLWLAFALADKHRDPGGVLMDTATR